MWFLETLTDDEPDFNIDCQGCIGEDWAVGCELCTVKAEAAYLRKSLMELRTFVAERLAAIVERIG